MMRFKLFYILTIASILLTGCQGQAFEKPQDEEDTKIQTEEIQVEEEKIETTKEETEDLEEEVEEVRNPYIGQAFDTITRDGKQGVTDIYKEKDNQSEIIASLEDYDEVELLEIVPLGWYKVRLDDGTEGYADARYIRTKEIPPYDFNKEIEGYAIVFTEKTQTIEIYKDGEVVMESKGSSGLWDHFTPKGIFEIEEGRRGQWYYVERFQQGMKYWVGFKGLYLFHSLPYTEDQEIIEEEAEKLGEPASHGCVRLPLEVAKYIYDNVPAGSMVLIQ